MTAPADFSTDLLTAALREMWGLEVREIVYVPIGFGSHHWRARTVDGDRWFVTLDDYAGAGTDVERGAALSSAFRAARALADVGLDFVVASVPARDGSVPFELRRHQWVSVTPWLEAPRLPSPDDQTAADRRAVPEASWSGTRRRTGRAPNVTPGSSPTANRTGATSSPTTRP